MTVRKINLRAAFDRIPECWSPHVARRVNDHEVRLARIDGAFDWHSHADTDEAFFVIRGEFRMEFRNQNEQWAIELGEGDLITVPMGVEHRPVAAAECWIAMFEKSGAVNTGDRVTERTRRELPELS